MSYDDSPAIATRLSFGVASAHGAASAPVSRIASEASPFVLASRVAPAPLSFDSPADADTNDDADDDYDPYAVENNPFADESDSPVAAPVRRTVAPVPHVAAVAPASIASAPAPAAHAAAAATVQPADAPAASEEEEDESVALARQLMEEEVRVG